MNASLAKFLSVVFNPLLMTTLLMAGFYFFAPQVVNLSAIPPGNRWFLLVFVSIYTFVLPILIVFYMYKKKWIETLTLKRLADRRLPYLITVILYLSISIFLYTRSAQLFPTAALLFLTAIIILIVAIVSLWWQISAHSAAMGGAVGVFFATFVKYQEPNLLYLAAISVLLAGSVLTARLALQVHTLSQAVAGFSVGLGISLFGYYLL